MKYYILVFLIVLVLLFIIFYHESEHIRYYMSCFMNSKNNAGLPTPIHCKNTVSKFISSIQTSNQSFTLVDFGAGDGDALHSFYPFVSKAIGIEIDEKQATSTRDRFQSIPSVLIEHQNMVNYQFENVPTILYMYEPLWCMKKEEAIPI